MTTLTFEPLIPPVLWMALAVLAAAVLAIYGFSRPGGLGGWQRFSIVGLMSLGVAVPLVVLLNPVWVRRIPPPSGKPRLNILLDLSASMATADAPGGQTRYQAASQVARRCSEGLAGRFEVQVRTFAGTVTAASAEGLASLPPEGATTDLSAAILEGLSQGHEAGQAMLLLSDGIHTAGGGPARVLEAARAAQGAGTPIYTKTFGGTSSNRDLRVEAPLPQQLAFAGQQVPVPVLVRQIGLPGRTVAVTLTKEGQPVQTTQVALAAEAEASAEFVVQESEPGLYRYDIDVAPVPGEVTALNNRATMLIRVVDQPIRVLLLEGKPYWDSKFLMRTLASDPLVELDSAVQLSRDRILWKSLTPVAQAADTAEPADEGEIDPDLPDGEAPDQHQEGVQRQETIEFLPAADQVLADSEKLRSYQVIVLGRDADVFLTEAALENLKLWISRDSGSLVCYRGQPMARVGQLMDRLLPVRWGQRPETRFRVKLTERGRSMRWMSGEVSDPAHALAALPSLASDSMPERVKPLAVVVATAQGEAGQPDVPVVSYQPYGGGRVVVLEGAGMWRWAFLPPRYQEQEHNITYRALWQSVLRWLLSNAALLPGQEFALRTDKLTFSAQETVAATLLVRDERQVPSVRLTGGDLSAPLLATPVPAGDEPGTYRVPFGTLAAGRYEAQVEGADQEAWWGKAAFEVQEFFDEQLDLTARPDLMARISSTTGGGALDSDDPEQIAGQFKQHLESSRAERVVKRPAWDRWWLLAALTCFWGFTWIVRRFQGLT